MWSKIREQWKKYRLQMIGALALVGVYLLAILNLSLFAWVVVAGIGLTDLYLVWIVKQITISKWIRQLWGSVPDKIVMFGLIVMCWWLKGELVALWFLLGLLNNHLFEKD